MSEWKSSTCCLKTCSVMSDNVLQMQSLSSDVSASQISEHASIWCAKY